MISSPCSSILLQPPPKTTNPMPFWNGGTVDLQVNEILEHFGPYPDVPRLIEAHKNESGWMSQEVRTMVSKGVNYNLLKDGVYWGYNPLILTFY